MRHCHSQIDFIHEHQEEIVRVWEANKQRKGYIEVYITTDYKPYKSGFRFIEKRIRKNTFKLLSGFESESNNYALVHFLWQATYTQYRMAVGYENQEYANNDNSNHN